MPTGGADLFGECLGHIYASRQYTDCGMPFRNLPYCAQGICHWLLDINHQEIGAPMLYSIHDVDLFLSLGAHLPSRVTLNHLPNGLTNRLKLIDNNNFEGKHN